VDLFHVDPGVPQDLFQGIELVGGFIVDLLYAGIDEDLDAVDARGMGHVDGRVFDVGTVLCRLSDGVNLGVDGAEAVLLYLAIGSLGFIDETSGFGAMGHPSGRAIVSRSQDIPIPHDYGTYLCSIAGRALCHLLGNGHEILIPGQSITHRAFLQ
jgi:hypothetical protein